jgi:uncharacterized glyoxalase superfamily protein PhnB
MGRMQNRSVPSDTMVAHILYRDVAATCVWLCRVFGCVEHFRYGMPVSGIQVRFGNAVIMLKEADEAPVRSALPAVTIFLADVDTHYTRAVEAGAMIFEQLHETVYGERQYGAEDPEGQRWLFSQHVRDLSPEDWGGTTAR